eukprot:4515770-Heterocapsa_arctica.AAC.1
MEGMKIRNLPVHKEHQCKGLQSVLGAVLSGRSYHISIPRAKMAALIVATRALASRTGVSGKA